MVAALKNFAETFVAAEVPLLATEIWVSSAASLPSLGGLVTHYYLLLQRANNPDIIEIVKVIAVNGNKLTVERAQEGTAAKTFAIGDSAENRLTLGGLSEGYLSLLGGTVYGKTTFKDLVFDGAVDLGTSSLTSSALSAANKTLLKGANGYVYLGNPLTRVETVSSHVPTVNIGGTVSDILHTGNMGANSPIDAAKLEGKGASAFGQKGLAESVTEQWSFTKGIVGDLSGNASTASRASAVDWSVVENVPTSAVGVAGITQLSNSYVGVLETKAVTEKALSEGLATRAAVSHNHDAAAVTTGTMAVARLPSASVLAKGISQLSNKINGQSETKGVTEKALSDATTESTKSVIEYANGLVTRLTDVMPLGSRVSTLSYTDGVISTAVTEYNGVTFTDTFVYNPDGTLREVIRT